MKRCPSCQKQFPNSATHCSFDSHALELIAPSFSSGPNAVVLKPLSELADSRGMIGIDRALRIAISLCEATDNLHAEGKLAGSFDPHDILVGGSGEEVGSVVVIKEKVYAASQQIPESAFAYLSPEAARREALDAKSDVYGVGAILYEMLTGRAAFNAATAAALVVKQLLERPTPPRDLRPEIPARLQDVVLRALAKEKSERQQSISQLKRELEGALGEIEKAGASGDETTGALPPEADSAPMAYPTLGSAPESAGAYGTPAGDAPPQARPAMAPQAQAGYAPTVSAPSPTYQSARPPATAAKKAGVVIALTVLVLVATAGAIIFIMMSKDEAPAPSQKTQTAPPQINDNTTTGTEPTRPPPITAPGPGRPTVSAPPPPIGTATNTAPGNRTTANANASRTPADEQPVRSVEAGKPVIAIIALAVALLAAAAAVAFALLWRKKPARQPGRFDSAYQYPSNPQQVILQSPHPSGWGPRRGGEEAETVPDAQRSSSREVVKWCLVCKTEYTTTARFCHRDGSPLREESRPVEKKDSPSFYDLQSVEVKKRCPSCNAEYPPGSKFCRFDGQQLVEVRGAQKGGDEAPEIEPFLVGQYRCFARLGEGGMGMVYKAKHVHLMRLSAVKVLLPQTAIIPDVVRMFRREAQLASSITHPNSVIIYDYGELDSQLFYLAMEFIPGQSLASIIEPEGKSPRPLAPARVINITRQVADALDAAHSLGIIHRDLKPQNVMVCQRPNRAEVVKVVDFGIARSLSIAHEFETEAGVVMGTPAYMSPEQARGARDLDARTDVFSLAVMVYQMFSGSLPFPIKGLTTYEVVHQRANLHRPALALNHAYPHLGIPAAVDDVLMRAMEPDRSRRTQSAIELAEALEKAIRA